MENMEKALYRVTTRGCGTFYVVASSFDYAAGEVTRELNAKTTDIQHRELSQALTLFAVRLLCQMANVRCMETTMKTI